MIRLRSCIFGNSVIDVMHQYIISKGISMSVYLITVDVNLGWLVMVKSVWFLHCDIVTNLFLFPGVEDFEDLFS